MYFYAFLCGLRVGGRAAAAQQNGSLIRVWTCASKLRSLPATSHALDDPPTDSSHRAWRPRAGLHACIDDGAWPHRDTEQEGEILGCSRQILPPVCSRRLTTVDLLFVPTCYAVQCGEKLKCMHDLQCNQCIFNRCATCAKSLHRLTRFCFDFVPLPTATVSLARALRRRENKARRAPS